MKLKNAWNEEIKMKDENSQNCHVNIGSHLKASNLEITFSKRINNIEANKPTVDQKTGKILYGVNK